MVAKNTPNKRLTRKQQLFVKELVSNDGLITNREAAERAGYPASSAHTRAYELMNPNKCPHVVAEIKKYRDELDEKYGVDFKRHIRDLAKIKQAALDAGAYSAAVQAERLRGMAQGDIYVSKSEIRHGTIDQMSAEEVERELQRIREGFEQVIDITPNKVEEITAPRDKPLEIVESKPVEVESVDRDNPNRKLGHARSA
jgi:phage terminase small subunit